MLRRKILVHNLLQFKELQGLLSALPGIPVMLLKGGALLLCGCRGYSERAMEDLDLLVRPGDLAGVIAALEALGFVKFPFDPWQYRREGVAFDLHDRIWYLTEAEHGSFWSRSRAFPVGGFEARIPAARDMLIHVLAHAAVHHGRRRDKWVEDVRAVLSSHAAELSGSEVHAQLRLLGLWPAAAWFLGGVGEALARTECADRLWEAARRSPTAWLARPAPGFIGHFSRLLFLRDWRFRMRYLAGTLFPGAPFLARRYELSSPAQARAWMLLRPWLLAWSLARSLAGRP